MYRPTLLSLVIAILIFPSCQTDLLEDETTQNINSNIQSELTPYFQSFKDKALEYGLAVDYTSANVTAKIELINNGSVAGTCTTNGHNLRDIVIDQAFWDRASSMHREMVIFHELGHCVLGRGHTESSFNNGICKSIMRSGLGECRDAYTEQNRDYFIEELFLVQE